VLDFRFAIDENLIGTSSQLSGDDCAVDNCEDSVVSLFDVSVVTGGSRIIKDHCVVWCATNGAGSLRQKIVLPLTATSVGDLKVSHARLILAVAS
jgi:hypothetical protein